MTDSKREVIDDLDEITGPESVTPPASGDVDAAWAAYDVFLDNRGGSSSQHRDHRLRIEAAIRAESAGPSDREFEWHQRGWREGFEAGRAESAGLNVERLARAMDAFYGRPLLRKTVEDIAAEYARLAKADRA